MGKSWSWPNSLALAALLGLWGCASDCDDPVDVSGVEVEVQIDRLESALKDIQTPEQGIAFMDAHPGFAESILGRSQAINDTILAQAQLMRMGRSPFVDTICLDIDRIFGDFSAQRNDFQTAFAHIKYYYPEARLPRIQTFVSGYGNFQVSDEDSLLFIGLEYFLGPTSTYYQPSLETPNYFLAQFYPESLVPKSLLMLALRFANYDAKDQTLLSHMIYFGKTYYFAKRMLPCTPDSTLLGYTGEELARLRDNAGTIYAHFASNELFYSTDAEHERKYVAERPATPEIGEACPGRTGRWMGYEIVCEYMNRHPEVTLQQLMDEPSASLIFQQAHYKPKNN